MLQPEVAQIVAKHRLLAMPVVDDAIILTAWGRRLPRFQG
jgi:Mg/Co/Ni transporter MgtE